eukprot:12681338-Alexandrium_andersonii.AAC.1
MLHFPSAPSAPWSAPNGGGAPGGLSADPRIMRSWPHGTRRQAARPMRHRGAMPARLWKAVL